MALIQRPTILSEVLIRKDQSVYGTVTVPEDTEINIGTLIISEDGGVTWNVRQEADWEAGSYDTDATVYYAGHIWKSLVDVNDVTPGTDPAKWDDQGVWEANGMLLEYAGETGEYEVMKSGYAVEKYVTGFHEAMRPALFAKSIILK